jgi:hypothetical protein
MLATATPPETTALRPHWLAALEGFEPVCVDSEPICSRPFLGVPRCRARKIRRRLISGFQANAELTTGLAQRADCSDEPLDASYFRCWPGAGAGSPGWGTPETPVT